jgi:hypothetical protein
VDGRDLATGFCLPLRLAEAAAPVPAAENSPETRGAGALRILGATWMAGEVGEGAGNLPVGTRSGQGPGGGGSAVALKDSGEKLNAARGNKKEGRGRGRFLTSRRTPGTPRLRRRRDGNPSRRWRTSATAQRTAGERGQRNSGRERGNWGVSRVADVGAKLTVAGGTTGLQRRRRNELGRRRLRGDGGADSRGPRAERAEEAGADAGEAAALTGGPARAQREEGGGRRVRGMGQMGRKAEGAGGGGFFPFFFYFGICFPFSFYLLYLIQI